MNTFSKWAKWTVSIIGGAAAAFFGQYGLFFARVTSYERAE